MSASFRLHIFITLVLQTTVYAKVFTQESGKKSKPNINHIAKQAKHAREEIHANANEAESMSWLDRMVTPRMMRAENTPPRVEVKAGKLDTMRASMMAAAAVSSSGEVAQGSSSASADLSPLVIPGEECRLSDWDAWSACNPSCGSALWQQRQNHIVGQASGGFPNCSTLPIVQRRQNQSCPSVQCPIDCQWNPWGQWNLCNASCYGAVQNRSRTSVPGTPAFAGAACRASDNVDVQSCNYSNPCPVDCQWSSWGNFSDCSQSCGTGAKLRIRSSTPPINGGRICNVADMSGTASCNTQPCPSNCTWNSWNPWGDCPATCYTAGKPAPINYRFRSNNPAKFGGDPCVGANNQTNASCARTPCPVNAFYAEWSTWGNCTASCGEGTRPRQRNCTSGAGNGLPCLESQMSEAGPCYYQPCPIACRESEWSEWGSCSPTCGDSASALRRKTIAQMNMYNGSLCPQDPDLYPIYENDTARCTTLCPIDCYWSNWGGWNTQTACPTGCVIQTTFIPEHRTRTFQKAMYGGSNAGCSYLGATNTRDCNVTICPIDCTWSSWSVSQCSVLCGGGIILSTRFQNQTARHGGRECTGDANLTTPCNTETCPPNSDCKWGEWSEWNFCTATCNPGGTQTQTRTQIQPQSGNGQNCTGDFNQNRACNANPCPCLWSSWGAWGSCCMAGTIPMRPKNRTIIREQEPGGPCDGETTNLTKCPYSFAGALPACGNMPVDCIYSDWLTWSPCTGAYKSHRDRPTSGPFNGGQSCAEVTKQTCCCANDPKTCPADSTPCSVLAGFFTVTGSFDISVNNATAFVDDDASATAMTIVVANLTKVPVGTVTVTLTLVSGSLAQEVSARDGAVQVAYSIYASTENVVNSIQTELNKLSGPEGAAIVQAAEQAAFKEANLDGEYDVTASNVPSFAVEATAPQSTAVSGTATATEGGRSGASRQSFTALVVASSFSIAFIFSLGRC